MRKVFLSQKTINIMALVLLFGLIFPAGVFAATLSLDPSSGTFNKGCTYSVKANLDTKGAKVDGADVILVYDTSKLSTSTSQINTTGAVFPEYPANSVSTPDGSGTGKITIYGFAALNQPFSGTGTVATINFTVPSTAQTGATSLKFDFDPADPTNTKDANVVENGTVAELLNGVTDGNYTIGSGSCSGASPSPSSSSSSTGRGGTSSSGSTINDSSGSQTTQTKSPPPQTKKAPVLNETALSMPTVILATVGGILVAVGALGLIFL